MVEQKTVIPGAWVGGLIGLFLGYVWISFGFSHTIFMAVCGAVGYLVAALVRGELDLLEILTRLQERNRRF